MANPAASRNSALRLGLFSSLNGIYSARYEGIDFFDDSPRCIVIPAGVGGNPEEFVT